MRVSQIASSEAVQTRKKRKTSRLPGRTIVSHKSFTPIMAAWGASLTGLSIAVLPASSISSMTAALGIAQTGSLTKTGLSLGTALAGGLVAFIAAKAMQGRGAAHGSDTALVSAVSRNIVPIDPVEELGSESLDSPLDETEADVENDVEAELTGEDIMEFPEALAEALEEADEPAHEGPSQDAVEVDEKRQPTLGELSKRGYEIEEPVDCSASVDDSEDGDKPLFTRRHFEAALLATCESESCESESCESEPAADEAAPEQIAEPDGVLDEPEIAEHEEPAVHLVTRLGGNDEAKPIGGPASNEAWSLTQFKPQAANSARADEAVEVEPTQLEEIDPPAADEAPVSQPVGLELSDFANMPGRDAVWVVEQSDEVSAAQTVEPQEDERIYDEAVPLSARAPQGVSPLQRLRQKSPDDLSLVELVERFAGALHERQEQEIATGEKFAGAQDAILSDALKALTVLTENGLSDSASGIRAIADQEFGSSESDLRDAIAKLQQLRGAA